MISAEVMVVETFIEAAISLTAAPLGNSSVFFFNQFDFYGRNLSEIASTFLAYTYECLRSVDGQIYSGFVASYSDCFQVGICFPGNHLPYLDPGVCGDANHGIYQVEFKIEADKFDSLKEKGIRVRQEWYNGSEERCVIRKDLELLGTKSSLPNVKSFKTIMDANFSAQHINGFDSKNRLLE